MLASTWSIPSIQQRSSTRSRKRSYSLSLIYTFVMKLTLDLRDYIVSFDDMMHLILAMRLSQDIGKR